MCSKPSEHFFVGVGMKGCSRAPPMRASVRALCRGMALGRSTGPVHRRGPWMVRGPGPGWRQCIAPKTRRGSCTRGAQVQKGRAFGRRRSTDNDASGKSFVFVLTKPQQFCDGTGQSRNLSALSEQTIGDNIRSGSITPASAGAHKRAVLLRNPCVLGGAKKRGQHQKWLHHPCLRGGPQSGET